MLTSPASRTRLRSPALLSQTTTRPVSMANTTFRGPFKDHLSRSHKHLHQIIRPSNTLSSGIQCLHTPDQPPIRYFTTKILRGMRIRRRQMWRQRDPQFSLACLRWSLTCQLMVGTEGFLFLIQVCTRPSKAAMDPCRGVMERSACTNNTLKQRPTMGQSARRHKTRSAPPVRAVAPHRHLPAKRMKCQHTAMSL